MILKGFIVTTPKKLYNAFLYVNSYLFQEPYCWANRGITVGETEELLRAYFAGNGTLHKTIAALRAKYGVKPRYAELQPDCYRIKHNG